MIYAHDDKILLCLAGLRTVRKEDMKAYGSDAERYFLYWSYKGQEGKIEYATKEARDIMYSHIVAKISSKAKE